MKTEKNILIAFLLNLAFSVFEVLGGILTGSVAILSDAVHDMGDAAGIGIAWLLEKKSKQPPDDEYSYGYLRYSVLGSLITTLLLFFGSGAVIYNAAFKLLSPTPVHYNGIILFALVGVVVNLTAALFTRKGDSLNQKAVSLHMLEDVLGWLVVLVGAVVMGFTGWSIIDPILSIGVSVFILFHGCKNLMEILHLFLEKTPKNLSPSQIQEQLRSLDGVLDVHHVHVRSIDGQNCAASMHIVTNSEPHHIKEAVRHILREHGVNHVTLELEAEGERCQENTCHIRFLAHQGHHHH